MIYIIFFFIIIIIITSFLLKTAYVCMYVEVSKHVPKSRTEEQSGAERSGAEQGEQSGARGGNRGSPEESCVEGGPIDRSIDRPTLGCDKVTNNKEWNWEKNSSWIVILLCFALFRFALLCFASLQGKVTYEIPSCCG